VLKRPWFLQRMAASLPNASTASKQRQRHAEGSSLAKQAHPRGSLLGLSEFASGSLEAYSRSSVAFQTYTNTKQLLVAAEFSRIHRVYAVAQTIRGALRLAATISRIP
jgi:hypothetical protein